MNYGIVIALNAVGALIQLPFVDHPLNAFVCGVNTMAAILSTIYALRDL